MFYFIVCLGFITYKAEANRLETVNPEPHFTLDDLGKQEIFTVVEGEPLNIFLENFDAKEVLCQNYYYSKDPKTIKVELSKSKTNDKDYFINVPKVTDEMSTQWKCIIRRLGKSWTPEILFILHVKGAKSVSLAVNELKLNLVRTNLSVTDFDGECNYSYVDGEVVDLSCTKIDDSINGLLHLQYYDAMGNLKFRTDNINTLKSLNFRSVMNSENNNYYINCTYTSLDRRLVYNYRTTFILKNQELDETTRGDSLIVNINGQMLTPVSTNSSGIKKKEINYIYYYIEGDILKVTCEKRKDKKDTLVFYYVHKRLNASLEPSGQISTTLNTSSLKSNSLDCHDKKKTVIDAKILLIPDKFFYGTRILGLSSKNVIYQYTKREKYLFINYEYTVNETLELVCVSENITSTDKPDLQWKFRREITSNEPYRKGITWNISRNFTLEAEDNGTSILCINKKGKPNAVVEVRVYLKPETTSDVNTKEERVDDDTKLFMILGCSFGVMIILITTACVVCWWRRTKSAEHIEKPYENFSNANDSPIPPFPSQWENLYEDLNYARIEENIPTEHPIYLGDTDKMYGTTDKRQSYVNESYYTEIDDNIKPSNNALKATCSNARHNNGKAEELKRQISKNRSLVKDGNSSNSIVDLRHASTETYDTLRRSNLLANNPWQNCSNYGSVSANSDKNKSVTFKQNNCNRNENFRSVYNNSKLIQDRIKDKNKIKQNSKNSYENVKPNDEYPESSEDVRTITDRGNDMNPFVKNENINGVVEIYSEPYCETTEVNCVNDLYVG